ncbi:hypothetical protein EVAR_32512_1 [Eumeta japonica]|uniref:RNA-directed DNA polymerase from mobile element jockey n=1 Tax=Eumeta variegata TaxID=151549 RepID=A0A4C1W7J5_EUMVA|nr:hypothetical protein EVAR_32512_1 [Eumeta japonica]
MGVVTACSSTLLNRAKEWQVVRDLNPQTITRPRLPCVWGHHRVLRFPSVHGSSEQRLKLLWWNTELEGVKRDTRTKKRCIQNATPRRWERRTNGDDGPPVISGDLPGMDLPFTGAEVKNALKAFPQKSSSIDGFMLDIFEVAIFRDMGLFLTMMHKYLELGHFPRAWKLAVIKIISKSSKDDYAHPKYYRSICLLPVLSKTMERKLRWAPPMALIPTPQATQYDFTPRRGTEDALYDLMIYIYI